MGSYLMVVGAFMSLVKPVRMSFFGTLITTWGLGREVIFSRKTPYSSTAKLYPTMVTAIVLAFLSIRKDVRKIVRTVKDWQWPIHLKQKYL